MTPPPFIFPLPSGATSSGGTVDQGVDYSAPGGTPLLAVASGTIVGHGIGGFGPWAPILKLDQPVNYQGHSLDYVYYGHAGPGHLVPVGTHVSQGTQIGEVGAGIVGISTGPHLEIGFSDVRGTPVGPKGNFSATLMHGLLSGSKALQSAFGLPQNSFLNQGTDALPNPLDIPSMIAAIPGKIVDSVFSSIANRAMYAGLAFVAILAGFYLFGRGIKRTTHAETTP